MKFFFGLTLLICTLSLPGQTVEEYKELKKQKESELKVIKDSVALLKTKIESFPGWKFGTFGTLGFNLSSFNNWQKGANPDAISSAIRTSVNAFANYDKEKLFWRTSTAANLGWQKLDTDKHDDETAEFEQVADVLRISSLFGYTLWDHLAMSTLLEYNTSVLSNFNNPGILDLGLGATWKPAKNLIVVMHPLNYHWVFGDDPEFTDALGAKIVADYTRKVFTGISWKSNLTTFLSYKSNDPSLSEWTWSNTLSFNIWKGVGVGFEFGLRKAEVEDPELQNFWVFGLSYSF
ncbi:MAG: DUF3078 domain-containing protein [Saprospiraceae bacterium]|nr:DUF3078 domain-containing protein [Saprospiraceae bacterium]